MIQIQLIQINSHNVQKKIKDCYFTRRKIQKWLEEQFAQLNIYHAIMQLYKLVLELFFYSNQMQSGSKLSNNRSKNSFVPDNFQNQFLKKEQSKHSQLQQQSQYSQEQSLPPSPPIKQKQQTHKETPKIKHQSNGTIKFTPLTPTIKNEKEKKVIDEVHKNHNELTENISKLKDQYKEIDMQEILFLKRSPQKQEKIKEFLKAKRQQKKLRKKKLAKLKQYEQRKREEIFKQKSEQKLVKPHDKLITKDKRQKQKQQREEKAKHTESFLKKFQVQKRFHQRKQQQDITKAAQQETIKKKLLQQHKQKFKPLEESQIQEHQRKHDELINNLDLIKKSQKEEKFIKIIEQNNRLAQNVYKGFGHQMLYEQMKNQKRKKKQPKKKIQSVKKYQKYVRENFKPKTHQTKPSELNTSNLTSRSNLEVRRYRYFQGHSIGQVMEKRHLAKSEAEQKKIGDGYLLYLRSLPKKKKQPQSIEFSARQIGVVQDKLNQIIKVKKQRNPLYDQRKKSLDMKISSQPTRDQLNMAILQLKNFDTKLKLKEKVYGSQRHNGLESVDQIRKQMNQNIIDNIERKLSLLSQL